MDYTRSFARLMLSLLVSTVLSAVAGCMTENMPAKGKPSVEASFDIPPRQMVDLVKNVVTSPPRSLPVDSEESGVVTTGWQRFPGDWHIARRWQERTRFFITIIPDWDKPDLKCRVSVSQETEQRAAEPQTWDSGVELNRVARAQDMLNQIRDAAAKK